MRSKQARAAGPHSSPTGRAAVWLLPVLAGLALGACTTETGGTTGAVGIYLPAGADAFGASTTDSGLRIADTAGPGPEDGGADAGASPPLPDATASDTTAPDSTAPDSTAPDATAPDATASDAPPLTEDVPPNDVPAPADATAPSDVPPAPDTLPPPPDALPPPDAPPPPKDGDAPAPCPSETFLAVSGQAKAGAAYPATWLEVTCDADTVRVQSNGIPHYAFQQITPHDLAGQQHDWRFPRAPAVADAVTSIPLLGVAGMTVGGIPIFGPNEGPIPDPYGDPVYNNIVDFCSGHTAVGGVYHNHALFLACFYPDWDPDAPSPIIGWSLDGFPIYGPRGCLDADCTQVVTFESSWVAVGDPSTHAWDAHTCTTPSCDAAQGTLLDRCNGRFQPDGTYGYHATAGFPYILGCFRGTPIAGQAGAGAGGSGAAGQAPPCDTDADCTNAPCPSPLGCKCLPGKNGTVCIPTCQTSADCPTLPDGGAMICGRNGSCLPANGPGGG